MYLLLNIFNVVSLGVVCTGKCFLIFCVLGVLWCVKYYELTAELYGDDTDGVAADHCYEYVLQITLWLHVLKCVPETVLVWAWNKLNQ